MKRSVLYSLVALFIIGAASLALVINRNQVAGVRASDKLPEASASPAKAKSEMTDAALVVAPGFVEAVSEEINVSAEISGKLREVSVEEGERVSKGQIIAVIDNRDYLARLAAAEAQLKQREADLLRLQNGSRNQEREEALAFIKEAEAVMQQAKSELGRREKLFQSGDISREETERAARAYDVAKAKYEAALQRHNLIENQTRVEEKAAAAANVAAAKAGIAEARAMLDKTIIRSPISGVVLRKKLHTGEIVSGSMGTAITPIITLADNSVLRVRVDVDETDVGRLQVGQRAYVTAEAFGDKRFTGKIIRIGQTLGKKNVRTERATERVDTKVLETLIELDPASELKLGLRVDAFIEAVRAEISQLK